MNKSPAFQWYPKDYLGSARVGVMTLAEEGAYFRALNYCWLNEYIPADNKKLALLLGKGCTVRVAEVVKKMFVPHPDDETKLIHERLEAERKKQGDYRTKQVANALKRWSKTDAAQMPPHKDGISQTDALPSSFPSSSADTKDITDVAGTNSISDFENWAKENFCHIEQLMARTGAEKDFTLERLHLFHLCLEEASRYPATTKAAMAGFEKYLIHSLNVQRRKNNASSNYNPAYEAGRGNSKEQPLSGRLTRSAMERYLGRKLTDDELAGFGHTEQS